MVRSGHSGSQAHRSDTPRGRKATDRPTSRRSKLIIQLGSLAVVGIAAGLVAFTPLLSSETRFIAGPSHDIVASPALAVSPTPAIRTVGYDKPTYDLQPQTNAELMAVSGRDYTASTSPA